MHTTLEIAPVRQGSPGDEDGLFEIVNGEEQEIPHMGAVAGTIASVLVSYLNIFVWQNQLGQAVVEVLFRLAPSRPARRPDVAFVAADRWSTLVISSHDPAQYEVVPNLAVEVISPTNGASEVLSKIQEYFSAGVQLVWVIYPEQRLIYVYESPTQIRILTETDDLDGGAVLPGFRLRIGDLFAALPQIQ